MNRTRPLRSRWWCGFLLFGAWLANAAPHLLPPEPGETIVFLGDSITHQSLYTQYLEDFLITRHPERPLRFRNAGVAGDSAADALARFEEDVAHHRPRYVTVLLGMNDGGYEDFHPERMTRYREDMGRLLDRIHEIGAQAILLSPTPFDHAVSVWRADDPTWRFRTKTISPHYNALLAYLGGWCQEAALERELPLVQLWGPMNTLTLEQRRTNPRFTLIGDAIHPNPSGQVLMAFEILRQMGVSRPALDPVSLIRQGDTWKTSTGISEIEALDNATAIRFRHLSHSLPWVIPEIHAEMPLRWGLSSDGPKGFELARAGELLSQERFQVVGLVPGRYALAIDGQPIGEWDHAQLAAGVNLQEMPNTPQHQQAMEVAILNRERTDRCVRPSRELASRIKGLRRKAGSNTASTEALAGIRKSIQELQQEGDRLLEGIYQKAQPKTHEWVLNRLP